MFIYLMMIDSPESQSKFEEIYCKYRGLMYHVAFGILNNEQDAEDAVHNAFVNIARHIREIDTAVCPKTQNYVVTIVENRAIDLYRANQRRKNVQYMDEIAGISVEDHPERGLANCILKLPPRYRQVIMLKYHHGFSCKEIAKQLNLSEANAIKLDQRAKKKLLQICEEEGIL